MPVVIARGQIAFTILDYGQEKATVRSRWIEINGTDSLVSTGTSGSYYTTRELAKQYVSLAGRVVLTFNDKILVFRDKALTFPSFGISELDTCYTILRDFLVSAGLGDEGEEFVGDFDWDTYSRVLTDYYDAEKRLNDEINKAIKSIADTANNALNAFLDGYQGTLTAIQFQIDRKAETWRQSTDPASAWLDNTEKAKHVGDLWLDTSAGGGNKTYIYQNTGTEQSPNYQWVAQDVPTEVFDKIDGKAAIYTAWNAWVVDNVSQLRVKDIFIPSSTTTQSGNTYYANRLYRCTNALLPSFAPLDYTNDAMLISWGADDCISPVEKNGVLNIYASEQADYGALSEKYNAFAAVATQAQAAAWQAYEDAADEFFADLAYITASSRWDECVDLTADVPYTPFSDVMESYYENKEEVTNMLDDMERSSYAYLTAALPAGASSDVADGLILRNIIGVEDDAQTPHVRAFINGIPGASDEFVDTDHGIIMFASGIPIPGTGESWDWTGAATKIFEDGTIRTNKIIATGGEIGGFTIDAHAIGVAPFLPPSGSARGSLLMQGELYCYDYSRSAVREVVIQTDLNDTSGLLKIHATGPYTGTALVVSAGNSTTYGTAIQIGKGIVKGLRPCVNVVTASAELSEDDYNVILGDNNLTVSLPSSPQVGQTYIIYAYGVGSCSISGNGKSIKCCFGSGNTLTSIAVSYYDCYQLTYVGTSSNYWMAVRLYRS